MHEILKSNRLNPLLTLFQEGRSLESSKAEKLEDDVRQNPQDIESRALLLGFYLLPKGLPLSQSPCTLKKLRSHICWLVENMPEHALAAWCTDSLLPEEDPELFSQMEVLWRKQLDSKPDNFDIRFNLSSFLESAGRYESALEMALSARKLKGKDHTLDSRIKFLRKIVKER